MTTRRGGGGGVVMGGSVTTPTESTRLLGASQPAGPQPFSAIAQPQQALQGRGSQQQQHQGHRHHEPHVVEVDPVERLVKHTLMAAAAFLLLGFLGVLALVLKALGFDRLPWLARLPPALHSYWAVFAPFWIADLVGLAFVVYLFYGVCTLRTATRDEKRTVTRMANRARLPHQHKVVSMEMFPLVQTLLRAALGALPFLACLAATQVLFCLRLEARRVGGIPIITVWQALLPALVYEGFAVLGALCLRHGSWQQGVAWALALLATLALALRPSPGAWPVDIPWLRPLWVAFTPLWALEAFLLLLLAHVALQAGKCARRYRLNAQHVACMVLYALSLLLFAAAQAFVAWRRAWEDALDGAFPSLVDDDGSSGSSSSNSRPPKRFGDDGAVHEPPLPPPTPTEPARLADALAGIAVFCAVGLACLALYLLAAETADHLVTSHGYEDPLPLSRTVKGWEPTGARTSSWLLLGRIEEAARLMRGQGVAGRGGAAGAMGRAAMAAMGGRGGQGQGAGAREGGRDLDASPSRPAGGELQRSNSGSYADLYADL